MHLRVRTPVAVTACANKNIRTRKKQSGKIKITLRLPPNIIFKKTNTIFWFWL